MRPRNFKPKVQGELAELAFVYKAAKEGFGVAKPYGDSRPYDFILEFLGRLLRVQVKSTYCRGRHGSYSVNIEKGTGQPYSRKEIDALVVYVVPEDAWYVIPFCKRVSKRRFITMRPNSLQKQDAWKAYREAWHLLR
jgi:PD-(D/E)XK endonuclease